MNTHIVKHARIRTPALFALALIAGAATWAPRHFTLARSLPSADATVASPAHLQLWFTQAPQEGSVSIRLIDAAGDAVDTGEPVRSAEDAKLMEVEVGHTLSAGAYTVAWRGIGDDGHVVRDDFVFTVQAER